MYSLRCIFKEGANCSITMSILFSLRSAIILFPFLLIFSLLYPFFFLLLIQLLLVFSLHFMFLFLLKLQLLLLLLLQQPFFFLLLIEFLPFFSL